MEWAPHMCKVVKRCSEGEACAPAHFVEKTDTTDTSGNIVGVRLVFDFRQLNAAVKLPTKTFPTGNDIW